MMVVFIWGVIIDMIFSSFICEGLLFICDVLVIFISFDDVFVGWLGCMFNEL